MAWRTYWQQENAIHLAMLSTEGTSNPTLLVKCPIRKTLAGIA